VEQLPVFNAPKLWGETGSVNVEAVAESGATMLALRRMLIFSTAAPPRCERFLKITLTMPLGPKLSADQLATNLADIAPRFTNSRRWSNPPLPFLLSTLPASPPVPTGIDIPAFIKKIMTGNVTGAPPHYPHRPTSSVPSSRACLPDGGPLRGACVMLDRD
jgi:hypothetical protein